MLLEIQINSTARIDSMEHVVCRAKTRLHRTHFFQIDHFLFLLFKHLILDIFIVCVVFDAVFYKLAFIFALSLFCIIVLLFFNVWASLFASYL